MRSYVLYRDARGLFIVCHQNYFYSHAFFLSLGDACAAKRDDQGFERNQGQEIVFFMLDFWC